MAPEESRQEVYQKNSGLFLGMFDELLVRVCMFALCVCRHVFKCRGLCMRACT